ncbi:protein KRI1 homolog [Teleopsis dalmanni]|uniref:protein KRI1 homolog n=1 Tax=Teleopsis dalmanni TaxID=139649 RepID=UPI0018CE6536|nr:protein KRI1 homolog [Teleopsis dalmanni]
MSKKLFDQSDESENEIQELSTNKEYAKSYNNFRKKELLKKYKDRGLDVSESDFSSNDSDSSEEDDVEDTKFDEEFFKTLASLKSKDPSIYDKNTRFFDHLDSDSEETKKEKKSKPVTLKDYERTIILEKGGKFEDDSNSETEDVGDRAASPTIVEEERNIKAEFKKVLGNEDSEDEEFGGIFKKRQKTKEEKDKEEEDYVNWLAGKKDDIEENAKEKLAPLKNYWSSNKLPQSERFLRDYILNKGYENANTNDIPTYDEIVGNDTLLSEDEQDLEKQAEFEQKYNFRYEEPDAEFIQRYPRTIENSVRRTDDKRKQKRQEQKERKKQEKEQKMKEIDIIKDIKRKEIEEKIRKLKLVTGNDELGFKDEELDEDFDPDAHDKRMQEIFNEEYYQVDEGEEKPDCPSDIDDLKIEDWDNYNPNCGNNDDYEPNCEDDDFNMDCDYDPIAAKEQLQQELIENTKGRKGRKRRKNKFKEIIEAEKPPFNPEDEQTYAEYIDEYYKLDCEDIIGDTPCRFKYVETAPNDFGLTIEEILLAKNKELNQWVSLKKAVQIRPDHIEKKDQRLYRLKAKNEELKRKIFKSLYGDESDEDEEKDVGLQQQQQEQGKDVVDVKPTNKESQEPNSVSVEQPQTEKVEKSKKKKRKAKTIDTSSETTVKNPQTEMSVHKKPKLETNSELIDNQSDKNNTTNIDLKLKNNTNKNKMQTN